VLLLRKKHSPLLEHELEQFLFGTTQVLLAALQVSNNPQSSSLEQMALDVNRRDEDELDEKHLPLL
jgi:hypothetical protein